MIETVLSLSISFIISLLFTPLVIAVSKKLKIYAQPNDRTIHNDATPTLGGIAIFIATIISIVLFAAADRTIIKVLVIVGLSIIELIGIFDDIKYLSARLRFLIVIILALSLAVGFYKYYLASLVSDGTLTAVLCVLFITLWIVTITNAINFVDGIDGLASYITVVSLLSFSIIFVMQNRIDFALIIALAVAGAVLGFMPYNRNKALIFMGDSGSTILGFILSFIAVILTAKSDSIFTFIVSVYILFVPIMEVVTSVMRRIIMKKPIYRADKMHFHHLLAKKIDSHIVVAIILTVIHIFFCFTGILIFRYEAYAFGMILLACILIVVLFVFALIYKRIYGKLLKKEAEEN